MERREGLHYSIGRTIDRERKEGRREGARETHITHINHRGVTYEARGGGGEGDE